MTLPASNNGNPFPGLRSFEREQADLFFGRDEQTRELIARLDQHRFLPIVGMSGSGKSSLVRAGLIPALTGSYDETDTSGWRIALFRPGSDPIHELAVTLCREFAIPESDTVLKTLRGSSAGLARVAQEHVGPEEKLLVLVDQFEELFRYGEDADGTGEADDDEAFVKLLLAAAGKSELPLPGLDDLPVYVVTTMRSDFLGKCSRFRGLPEALNESQYLIPRMTREQQRDAIEGPVGMAGGRIEPALVQRLLNDLGDNQDQLPALQHALMRSWEHSTEAETKGKAITVADYKAIGGMADALNIDADRVYASLSRYDAAIARCLFQRLVQPGAADGETRSPTPLSVLVAITDSDKETVKRIIDAFRERGFLTVSSGQDPIIDIPHESLIRGWARLKAWVQEEEESSKIYCRLADTAELQAKGKTSWFVNPELETTLKWREEQNPNPAWAARYDSRFVQAMEFLEQSRKKHEEALALDEQKRRSELKRARVTALVLGSLLLVVIGASIVALVNWKRTQAERDRSSRLLYDSNIYFAATAVAAGQFTLAGERLDQILNNELKDLRGFEWFHLWRRVHADEATIKTQANSLRSITYSPDGTLVAAAYDHELKLWNAYTYVEAATLTGHTDYVSSVAFSPNGKTLASASLDNTVRLWDPGKREGVAVLRGHSEDVTSIAFSPDGKTLASGSDDSTVKLWDVASQTLLATLSGHLNPVKSLAFSPDGKLLASGGFNNAVKLWDIIAREEKPALPRHTNLVISFAFSPDSKTLALASSDNTIRLRDLDTLEEAVLIGHSSTVRSIVFSRDGNFLASTSDDRTVRLWAMPQRELVATLTGHSDFVSSVAFSPDGQTLASVSNDKTVKFWSTGWRKEVVNLIGHSDFVSSVAFSPDNNVLASGGQDDTIKLWDCAARKEIAHLSNDSETVWSVAFSPDGKTLASGSEDGTVKLWDVAARGKVAVLSGHSNAVTSVAFSPDGKTLASGSRDGRVKLWNVSTRTDFAVLSGHSNPVSSLAFSPDGTTLATGSYDFTVKLWNMTSAKEVAILSGDSKEVSSVAFSTDGKTIAAGSADGSVKIFDIATGKKVATLAGHSSTVRSVAFSSDGKTLASGSYDKTVKLWDIAAYKELATLPGDSGAISSVAFSRDGKILASGGADPTVRLWLAATDAEIEERRQRGY